jgi:hypothetical protein
MPDCFISYTTPDEAFAKAVHNLLRQAGLTVFLASISLQPGDLWSTKIQAAVDQSDWIILLASRRACASPYVQQEIGRALAGSKKLIPVIWDIDPNELPGWVNQYQALDIRGNTGEQVAARIGEVAARIKQDKHQAAIIAGSLIAAFLVIAGSSKA